MSDVVCAACGQELLPALEMCFDCELGNASPSPVARSPRRFRPGMLADDQARLTAVLKTLCPSARDEDVEWLAREREFDIVADVTPAQERRLAAALEACGLRVVASPDVPPSTTAVRLSAEGRVREKLAASAVLGGVTGALGVPLVPAAAVVMGCVLLSRMPRVVERRLTVGRTQVDAYLGVLDEAVLTEARAVRGTLSSPALRDLLRACLASAAEISGAARDGGLHLAVAGVRRADAAVAELARTLFKLVAKSQRIAPAREVAPSGKPYRAEPAGSQAALEQLRAFAADFRALQTSAAQLRARETAGAAASALVTASTRLSNACASALGALA
ncbi:MAG TPA: hypothetical protein VGI39_09975 [Polyangiaceae bacterium]|jgi:hypothetical protein